MVFLAEADFWSDFLGTKFSNFGILFFSNVFSWKPTFIFWKKKLRTMSKSGPGPMSDRTGLIGPEKQALEIGKNGEVRIEISCNSS